MLFALDPDFAPGGKHDGPEAEQFRLAHAAGFSHEVCSALILRANTPMQFRRLLAEAKETRAFAKLCAARSNVDADELTEQAIVSQTPVSELKSSIVQFFAEKDEATHTNTYKPLAMSAATGAIYAHRAAEADATRSKNG